MEIGQKVLVDKPFTIVGYRDIDVKFGPEYTGKTRVYDIRLNENSPVITVSDDDVYEILGVSLENDENVILDLKKRVERLERELENLSKASVR